jgi:Flp pilus assembly protein protease CpaA
MFELIALILAFAGSSVAAAWDLKTTEIPDYIPYIMIVVGLVIAGAQSYLQWSYWPMVSSLIVGGGLLGLGFLMYYTGQWGGGDAKLLAALGFLLPYSSLQFTPSLLFPFPVTYLINIFLVGAIYMILYALVLSLFNRKIIHEFKHDVKASSRLFVLGAVALFVAIAAVNVYLTYYFELKFSLTYIIENTIVPVGGVVALFFVWKFARAVESVGFKRLIPTSQLKVGDVLKDSKLWEGITEEQMKEIKKTKSRVWIKEGVRFAPAFPLALLFTIYFGDIFQILFSAAI